MANQGREDGAGPSFHIAIVEDDGSSRPGAQRIRLMLTPDGTGQEALQDLLKYASPSADAAMVTQHVTAILHGSSGLHLVGPWPPNVPGREPTASNDSCPTCGQKLD